MTRRCHNPKSFEGHGISGGRCCFKAIQCSKVKKEKAVHTWILGTFEIEWSEGPSSWWCIRNTWKKAFSPSHFLPLHQQHVRPFLTSHYCLLLHIFRPVSTSTWPFFGLWHVMKFCQPFSFSRLNKPGLQLLERVLVTQTTWSVASATEIGTNKECAVLSLSLSFKGVCLPGARGERAAKKVSTQTLNLETKGTSQDAWRQGRRVKALI